MLRVYALVGTVAWLMPLAAAAQAPANTAAAAAREPEFSAGLALAFAHFSRAESEQSDAHSPARSALRFTLPCRLSVGTAGVELAPGIALGDLTTLSVYLGPSIELPVYDLRLRIGAGLAFGHNFSGGVYRDRNDVFGRLPITLGFRSAARFGAFLSVALGFGASQVALPRGGREFQSATAFDAGLGVWL